MDRLSSRFGVVLHQASLTFPWLSRVRLRYCSMADREHLKSWRQFSHACHRKDIVCWARAAGKELTDTEIYGITAHELGHIIGEEIGAPAHRRARDRGAGDEAAEREANLLALTMGFRVVYNSRKLEETVGYVPGSRRVSWLRSP